MTKDEALKLALEGLERSVATCFYEYAHQQVMSRPDHFINQTITAIKEALAQPPEEPVAKYSDIISDGGLDPRNTIPPQRTWVVLTDEQKDASRYRWLRDNNAYFTWIPSRYNEKIVSGFSAFGTGYLGFGFETAVDLAIEAALKEKNT